MRFAYGYVMANEPDRVRPVVPEHVAYWRGAALERYLGGPFADRSGGLITFDAESLEQAEHLAAGDPFRREKVIDIHWLKEWTAD